MRSLSVKASDGGANPIIQNQIVYVKPQTSHMNFSTAVRMEANNPATNYSSKSCSVSYSYIPFQKFKDRQIH